MGQSQLGEDRWDLAISPSLDLYNIPPKLPHRSADLHYMYYTVYDFEKYGLPFSKYDLQSPICIILPQKPPTQILPIYLFWRRFVQCLGVNSGLFLHLCGAPSSLFFRCSKVSFLTFYPSFSMSSASGYQRSRHPSVSLIFMVYSYFYFC